MKDKTSRPYIHPFRVHVPNLLDETFTSGLNNNQRAALRIPINELKRYLATLTGRCAELNDPVLNKIMIDMTLYEESNPESKDYNQKMVDKVNDNYNDYLNSHS